MNEVANIFKSMEMKEKNANKAHLSPHAREIYLRGLASLGKADEVARSGNRGKGFTLPSYVNKDEVKSK